MKYIVSGAVVLRFDDGTSFSLTPGIHDDFPAKVKTHWAFGSYAEKLTDDNAAALAAGDDDLKAQLAALTETQADAPAADTATDATASNDPSKDKGNGKK